MPGKRASAAIFVLLASLAVPPAGAGDYVWLIGGGYDPDSSQAQIEQNVLWVSQLVRRVPGARTVRTYFDDGDELGHDVKELVPLRGGEIEPVRRLYAYGHIAGYRYRNHALPHVDGGTERASLTKKLEREIAGLEAGDRLLLVFNGHGTRSRRDPRGNRLWLWNGTSLDVRELDALLAQVPRAVSVRFVFTQCYAGAFARLAPGPDGNRCGFLAEAEDRQAEGCAAGVDANDYRDYTTYFFAALAGRTRLGQPLPVNPDLDGDGQVSFHEAHLYALRVGESADLPRATSEMFLERWQPWYADWKAILGLNTETPAEGVYAWLAGELMASLDLPAEERALRRELRRLRAAEALEARTLKRRQRELLGRIGAIQRDLRKTVAERWPALERLLREGKEGEGGADLEAATAFLRSQSRYAELAQAQDEHEANENALLASERRASRLDKVERLRKLARLQGRFASQASAAERDAYEKLLACERQGL